MQNLDQPVYQARTTKKDKTEMAKAIVYPMGAFFLSIITIELMQKFGKILLSPMLGVMWFTGALTAFRIPQQRKECINQTLTMVVVYCVTILGLHELMAITSGVSAEMLAATFNQTVTTSSANTIVGFLNNALLIFAVMEPASFIIMQVKRWLMFNKKTGKEKQLKALRNIRGEM